jgi:hypothetical protein
MPPAVGSFDGDDHVVVVAHQGCSMQQNPEFLGFAREAIDEGILDLRAGNQQEEALDAAARIQVGASSVDGTRLGHQPRYRKPCAAPVSRRLRAKSLYLQAKLHPWPYSLGTDGR